MNYKTFLNKSYIDVVEGAVLPQLSKLLIFHDIIVWLLALKSTKSIFKLDSQLSSYFFS